MRLLGLIWRLSLKMSCTINDKNTPVLKKINTSSQCHKCQKKAIIDLQHGSLCSPHFLHYFEEKVFKTIKKYRLFEKEDKVCVAASGGKDSTAALYLVKKYFQEHFQLEENVFALLIDEGIEMHRNESKINLEQFCKKENVPLEILKVQDYFSTTLDKIAPTLREAGKKPCTVCGVWRRYLLNKKARELGATKVVTGHNLDDEAQAIIMNTFKANTTLTANLGPISGTKEHPLFVQRVKPLFFCTNEEIEIYTKVKEWTLDYCNCIYSGEGYRSQVKKMLNEFEEKYPGTKQGIIKSYLELLPILKEKLHQDKERGEIQICQNCGEPANSGMCNACKLVKELVER